MERGTKQAKIFPKLNPINEIESIMSLPLWRGTLSTSKLQRTFMPMVSGDNASGLGKTHEAGWSSTYR